MKFHKTKLIGLYIIELEPFQDERGEFYRVLCKNELKEIGHKKEIVQINFSNTIKEIVIQSGFKFLEHNIISPGDAGISTGQLIGGIFRNKSY